MTGTRRVLVLIGLTLAVTAGAAIPASATFGETVALGLPTVSTGTVAAPASVVATDSCVTTTTTVTRTIHTHPGTGVTTQTYYNSSTTTESSTSNVQGTTTTTAAGPRPHETTTTTVTKNTDLHVTLTWSASASRGVNGYAVSAHLGVNDSVTALLVTNASTRSVTQVQDADDLAYRPSLFVTTRTTYGWTADSARTAVLSC